MNWIRQKRQNRSNGLVNPQIAPSTYASIAPLARHSWARERKGLCRAIANYMLLV